MVSCCRFDDGDEPNPILKFMPLTRSQSRHVIWLDGLVCDIDRRKPVSKPADRLAEPRQPSPLPGLHGLDTHTRDRGFLVSTLLLGQRPSRAFALDQHPYGHLFSGSWSEEQKFVESVLDLGDEDPGEQASRPVRQGRRWGSQVLRVSTPTTSTGGKAFALPSVILPDLRAKWCQ